MFILSEDDDVCLNFSLSFLRINFILLFYLCEDTFRLHTPQSIIERGIFTLLYLVYFCLCPNLPLWEFAFLGNRRFQKMPLRIKGSRGFMFIVFIESLILGVELKRNRYGQ